MQQKIVMSVHISSEKRRTQALKIAAGTTGTYVRMNHQPNIKYLFGDGLLINYLITCMRMQV